MKYLLLILLQALIQPMFSAQIDSLEIYSAKMNKKIPTIVITPSKYKDKDTKFPVLYLLHGLSDDHTKWIKTVPAIKDLADQYQLMIVCPDGGYGSWYLDSPIDPSYQYETFLANELLTFIDAKYRTIANKGGRIITGLSMGGHGALYIASRNAEKFVAAGSMSGAVDMWKLGFESGNDGFDVPKRLGDFKTNEALWKKHSIVFNTPKLKEANLHYYIDCGTEDFLIEENRELHRRMVHEKIPHEYVERPGNHSWEYWSNAIVYQLAYLNQFLVRK